MSRDKNGAPEVVPSDGGAAIPGTGLILRAVRYGDANRILALMRQVFIDEMGWDRAFLADAANTLVDLLDADNGPGNLFLVCVSDRKIVGLVALRDAGERVAFIRWLVVHRSVRGIGLGRLLLERALAFAGSAGFGRVRLVTVGDLPGAFAFYRRAGFREVARKPDLLWNMPHDLRFMEREIPPR